MTDGPERVEKEEGNRWSLVWPFLSAMLLFVCNVDWVVAPLLNSYSFSFWNKFFILAPLANTELVGWYCFWRWFFTSFLPERKKIKETINFTKEVALELKTSGYADRVVEHFESTFEWAVNPNRHLFKIVKAWGHFGMLFLGFEPFIAGGRVVGVIFCATTGWKNGLISLIIGNSVHVIITISSWDLLFYLWNAHRIELVGVSIASVLLGLLYKKLRGDKDSSKSP